MSTQRLENPVLRDVRTRLIEHPIYAALGDQASLRTFMEHHVFAVWDFMCIVKSLQRDLTCVEVGRCR